MFTVDEPAAEAIRRADHEGELAGVVELHRHPHLLADSVNARLLLDKVRRMQDKEAG